MAASAPHPPAYTDAVASMSTHTLNNYGQSFNPTFDGEMPPPYMGSINSVQPIQEQVAPGFMVIPDEFSGE